MQDKAHNSVAIEPMLLSVEDTAKILSISKPMLYQMFSDGRFGLMGIRFGRKRLFPVEELRNWVQAGCPSREKWQKIHKREKEN